jgi:hypothetical protein
MADEPAPSIVITFLGQNNLVDEPTAGRIGNRQPRDFNTTESALQRFEQRHEIPHGKDVVFHEQVQRLQAVDPPINGVL